MTYVDEYTDAEGTTHYNPLLKVVVESISGGSQTNWEYGSGQAVLYWRRDRAENSLVLTPGGDSSYFVQYFSSSIKEGHLMSASRNAATGTSEVFVGGDPWQIPTELFVDKPSVLNAIRDFYHNGEPSTYIKWIRDNEIEWPCQE